MANQKVVLWIALGFVGLLFFTLMLVALFFSSVGGESADPALGLSWSGAQLVVIELEGIIFESKLTVDLLKKYGESSTVKGIVLRIDSPGGGVAASQEIYAAVNRLRKETKKPVVASMGSVAASGGYYVACAADKIVANPGTITGSIGVIAEWYNRAELVRWAKLQDVVIKSGEMKDAPNPNRPLTEKERAYLQELIDEMYDQFLTVVSQARKMSKEKVRPLADGRVYTGSTALRHGLIDSVGTLQDSIDQAAKLAGIDGKPSVIYPKKRRLGLFDLLLGGDASMRDLLPALFNTNSFHSQIVFEYLWR
jgi:protease-4